MSKGITTITLCVIALTATTPSQADYLADDAYATQGTRIDVRYDSPPSRQVRDHEARVYDRLIARFLQTDPVGYRDSLNAYQYVLNDPLNHSDPTGQYVCDPSPCPSAIGVAVKDISIAAAHADTPSASSGLQSVSNLLGERGDKGVTIAIGGNAPNSGMSTNVDSNGNVTVNVAQAFAQNAQRYSSDQRATFAAKLAHEGAHGIDGRARGGNPTNVNQERATERNGYRTQIDAIHGLQNAGLRTPTGTIDGIPPAGSSESTNQNAANDLAEQSVTVWCNNGGNC